jgi:hypothetical protein
VTTDRGGPVNLFQLRDTDDPALLDEWMASWEDLTEFEVYPVLSSAEAAMQALD